MPVPWDGQQEYSSSGMEPAQTEKQAVSAAEGRARGVIKPFEGAQKIVNEPQTLDIESFVLIGVRFCFV